MNISNWIKSYFTETDIVPFYKTSSEKALHDLDILCEAINKIELQTSHISKIPAALERELQALTSEILIKSERLDALQKNIFLQETAEILNQSSKYTLESISRFLGRIDNAILTFEKVGTDNELQNKIDKLNIEIDELKKSVNEKEINRKIDYALKSISLEMSNILKGLDVENPTYPAELLINDLTLKIKSATGRDDYLWEIGSASNWLSYHIACILSLHKFFSTLSSINMPNFIIFDQPSQVYFPSSTNLEQDLIAFSDDDKAAVKKIFITFSNFVKTFKPNIQIIVVEHAEEDVWGALKTLRLF